MTNILLPIRLSGLCRRNVLSIHFLIFFLTFQAIAQEDFKPKLGVIDRASLEMTAFPGDSTADAVYLYDYGKVTFSYDNLKGILMSSEIWVRIKILKESALDRASVGIPFYEGSSYKEQEWIEDLKGYTYNLENGQIVRTELEKKAIRREKSADSHSTTKFNLANVKKGSVIEYSYTRVSPINVRNEPDTWTFQSTVPSKWSEFNMVIPYFLDYKMTMGGYLQLHMNKQEPVNVSVGHSSYDGKGISYRFVVKDAPAFINEPYITTAADYVSKISFELASVAVRGEIPKDFSQTWDDVERTLDEAKWFGGELRRSGFLKEVRDQIAAKTTDQQERVNLAYKHVQDRMKWDGYSGLYAGDGIKKAYDNRKGNACDINLMLTVLLRELDIECNPVMLSTRAHGYLHQHIPMIENFNYVVAHVKIGEKEYFLDASEPFAKPGMLPERALNGFGRLIPKKGQGRFLEIIPGDSESKLEMITANIVPDDGTIKGSYSISYGGYEALGWRSKYAAEADNIFHDQLKKEVPEWKIQNVAIKNKTDDLKGTVNVTCDFEIEDENASPGVFYFNPIMAGRWTTNPLKSKDRIYPIDLGTGISASFIGNFTLPNGYALEEMPKAEIIVLPDKGGKFSYQVRQVGNVIQVNTAIQVSRTRFLPEEYADLKEFFERVVQKHAQPLVIKKKTI
ncbi:DUF3857 and transglutaminase domain-containing protein [Dyadobacter sp. CY261]|uniref:DUF3857 domain-containing protein n=1 Tax=Dyadobacter sp. CY261 TaxID=2907203 RepID=UPI001F43B543|nr:DUF3857 domain-containing protein [Dyadobacter sp. CY261]MCF0072126.1 DUF3857 and transglutaminase domain-containing protein [Dyadobacter sp. CY261]